MFVALPLLAAGRAIWEFFSERVELEPWKAGGAVPVEVEPEDDETGGSGAHPPRIDPQPPAGDGGLARRARRDLRRLARPGRVDCPREHLPAHAAAAVPANDRLRSLVRETRLDLDDFVFPLFVGPRTRRTRTCRRSAATRSRSSSQRPGSSSGSACARCSCSGSRHEKDAEGSGAWDEDGVVQQALRALARPRRALLLLTDVCLCEYTSHGHCGVLDGEEVDNDATLDLLARTASATSRPARTPSPERHDGRPRGRDPPALDEAGREQTPIVSYSAKYASAFYGPFREAAESAPAVRRPARLPDGSRERPRGAARVRAGRRGGSRRADGQAGAAHTST